MVGKLVVGGSHCFWNFCQVQYQAHYLSSPPPPPDPCTHTPRPVNGKVHSTLQPKLGGLPRCLLFINSAPPSPISLSPSPSLYLSTWLSLAHLSPHLNCHLTGLEPVSPRLPKSLTPSTPFLSKLFCLPAAWGSLSIANLTISLPFLKTLQGFPWPSG